MKKTDLQKDGFDPKLAKNDKLYYLDLKQGRYLPLGVEEYEKINNGQIRLWSVLKSVVSVLLKLVLVVQMTGYVLKT